jgi:hypothetical protein
MGSQFSAEFLLGYRAGHRDGFADAVLLMRDAATVYAQSHALEQREAQLAHLLSGGGLVSDAPASSDVPERTSPAEAYVSK